MYRLIIESSTEKGLIVCAKEKELLFKKEFLCGQTQADHLMPCLQDLFKSCSLSAALLQCIAVGVGPGSYTGIRVAASVAQALAFSRQIPIIELSSLSGFIAQPPKENYAAIIDARIAGVYIQKNVGEVSLEETFSPDICSLEQLKSYLGEINYLVTPNCSSLQMKLKKIDPEKEWQWEERFPCAHALIDRVDLAYRQKKFKEAGKLQLLYLKKTFAERQKRDL